MCLSKSSVYMARNNKWEIVSKGCVIQSHELEYNVTSVDSAIKSLRKCIADEGLLLETSNLGSERTYIFVCHSLPPDIYRHLAPFCFALIIRMCDS